MNNLLKKTILKSAVVALALSSGVIATANAEVTRLSGSNRYSTSDALVRSGWPMGSDAAVLASGLDANRVDALTVAPLAKAKNAPVVLVNPTDSVATIVSKFTALNTKTIYIANGMGVISTKVEEGLKFAGISTVKRIGGTNRYQTALNIAKELGASTSIVIANGDNAHLVDSLSIAPIAAAKGMPIFLASSTLDAATTAYINSLGVKTTYVLGGTTVVSNAAVNALQGIIRLAGAGRYETNLKVVDTFKSDAALNLDNVFIASGENANLIDALAGAPLAASKGSLIIFTNGKDISEKKKYIDAANYKNSIILGGTGAVSQLSEDLLSGKITELDIIKSKSQFNFNMKDSTGLNYAINIFSDDKQTAVASFDSAKDWAYVWAGANQGEKLSKGHYKIAVSKDGDTTPQTYAVSNNEELTLNLDRKLIRVHNNVGEGQPDFLLMGMPGGTSFSDMTVYYIKDGRLKLASFISNGETYENAPTYSSQSLFFNQLDGDVFETSTYNNFEIEGGQIGFYVHSLKFDLTSGNFTFLDTKFMDTNDYFDYAK